MLYCNDSCGNKDNFNLNLLLSQETCEITNNLQAFETFQGLSK